MTVCTCMAKNKIQHVSATSTCKHNLNNNVVFVIIKATLLRVMNNKNITSVVNNNNAPTCFKVELSFNSTQYRAET